MSFISKNECTTLRTENGSLKSSLIAEKTDKSNLIKDVDRLTDLCRQLKEENERLKLQNLNEKSKVGK